MTNLKESAKNYEPKTTLNIADLGKVSVNENIHTREGTTDDGQSFTYQYISVDDEDYRVPISVIKALKTLMEDKPELEFFKVKKEGTGLNTTYMVIPL